MILWGKLVISKLCHSKGSSSLHLPHQPIILLNWISFINEIGFTQFCVNDLHFFFSLFCIFHLIFSGSTIFLIIESFSFKFLEWWAFLKDFQLGIRWTVGFTQNNVYRFTVEPDINFILFYSDHAHLSPSFFFFSGQFHHHVWVTFCQLLPRSWMIDISTAQA